MQRTKESGFKISYQLFRDLRLRQKTSYILNSLIYFEPMVRFQNISYMMQFWSSGDGTGSRVENKLETIDLSKSEQERVAIINFRKY